MREKSILRAALLMLIVFFSVAVYAAAEPSMHQVYLAAEAGKFDEAQSMMDKVLRDHPNSAKAHFVEAELMAKQRLYANAEVELHTAERLGPGLPFAKPAAVENLKVLIAASHATTRTSFAPNAIQATSGSGMPWGLLIAGGGLIAFIWFAVRFMNRKNAQAYSPNGMASYGASPTMQSYGSGAPAPMIGPAAGGGLGSGILSGLATGAAVGAGMVAGEALMHHFTDGNRNTVGYVPPPPSDDYSRTNDMGGTDFGIADNSSWDVGSSGGGGDDWDS